MNWVTSETEINWETIKVLYVRFGHLLNSAEIANCILLMPAVATVSFLAHA